MRNLILSITCLFFLFNIGCDRPSGKPSHDGNESIENKNDPSTGSNSSHNPVALNQGQKWPANPETTQGIIDMQGRLTGFTATPTPEDYHALMKILESDFKLIFQRCTMTGEAHNQLHNYLLPLKQMIEDLDSSNPEECRNTLKQITQHLSAYSSYFI